MCLAVVLDADDGFRAAQPHIWISALDPLLPVARFRGERLVYLET
jgi:hypothetical protein